MKSIRGFLEIKKADLDFIYENPKSFLNKSNYLIDLKTQLSDIKQTVFFIIAVPGCLHLLKLCLKFVPPEIKIIIISNGLSEWEICWVKRNLYYYNFLVIPSILQHGDVIDVLVKNVKVPFGILDFDCFVFNSDLFFEAIKISDNHQLNAFFVNRNKELNLDLPETFFLFLNAPIYQDLLNKYRIGCRHTSYFELPWNVRKKLNSLGVDKDHTPEGPKNYYDTLRALFFLGITEGYQFNFVKRFPHKSKPSSEIFHVGGSSNPNTYKHLWGVRGSYFWWKLLENQSDNHLFEYYKEIYGNNSSMRVLDSFPDSVEKIGKDFFDFIDLIISEQISITQQNRYV